MTNPRMTVVAVLSDLMFTVKIQDAAKRAGLTAVFVKSRPEALALAQEGPAVLILDLNDTKAEPLALIEELKSNEETSGVEVVGFVSHVQLDLRQAAQDKGCDLVIARSAFSQNLPALLGRYAGVGATKDPEPAN